MIDKEQVMRIAKLARLELKEEEIAKYQQDLSEILDYFDTLKKVSANDVEPMLHSATQENIVRDDVGRKEDPVIISRMMRLVFSIKDGFVKVKTILISK
jgi:aspartyl-tRNA(Asn)/glutamyl-tRNA(Gln) amidotransferase subunit C